jgi:hypothetical protein
MEENIYYQIKIFKLNLMIEGRGAGVVWSEDIRVYKSRGVYVCTDTISFND